MKSRLITLYKRESVFLLYLYNSVQMTKKEKILTLLFVNLIYNFTRSIWSLRDYQCPLLRLQFSILVCSSCGDSYQGVDHPGTQNYNQT